MLEQKIKRTYTIGVRLEGKTRKTRRKNELRANTIIKELQQAIRDKITPAKMDKALALVRQASQASQEYSLSGTKEAAKLAAHFKDRSNLGQVAYLTMLNAAKGTIDRERKIKRFCLFLHEEPTAAVEWLVFGRSPHLEWLLQHQLQVAYDYSRNLIHSARRTVDAFIPTEYQLTSALPVLSTETLADAISQFEHSIRKVFANQAKLSSRQESFLKKLAVIYEHRQLLAEALYYWLLEWNNLITEPSSSLSRWRQFKRFVRGVEEWVEIIYQKKVKKYIYLAALRGCLISALLPFFQEGETVKELIENEVICAERLIAKPFRKKACEIKKTKEPLIPLSLLMGSKYVVGRPGSSTVMTKLASKEGGFTITIWPPRRKKELLTVHLRFHRRLQEMFANGARLALLILRSTSGPSGKLLVDLVLEGRYWMFLSQRRLTNLPLTIQLPNEPVKGVGVDINRIGPDMLAFSEQVELPSDVCAAIRHYLRLEPVLKALHRKLSLFEQAGTSSYQYRQNRQYRQLKQQIAFVYARRARLRKELHRLSCLVTAQVLYQTKGPVLCVEDLKLSVRGSRGALAKAILTMPDELDLYQRAILLVYFFTGVFTILQRVDPRNTSRGIHMGCSATPAGRLIRSRKHYDSAPCSACGSFVNTHTNAACLIRVKGLSLISDFILSLSALPAILSSSSFSSE
jgi:hypothetical protein